MSDFAELKFGLRRRGALLENSALLGGFICISSHTLAERLFVMVLKSNVSVFNVVRCVKQVQFSS